MAEFASRGIGAAGLTTGIIGTSLGALNSGILGNLFGGGNNGCGENSVVNRYELKMQQDIAAKDSKIALLESNIFVDSKIADVYEKLNTKIGALEKQCCAQEAFNAAQTSALGCINSQIAQLYSLTKIVIPGANICPPVTTTTT
jgi:hypothetical protein